MDDRTHTALNRPRITAVSRVSACDHRSFDLIVIGGGVYGLTLAIEAVRAGFRTAVLERGKVGQATSANWFRILHGGLRYLQKLDLSRFRESVQERRWFVQNFPDLVKPHPFLMPLYGNGLRRPSVFQVAFALDAGLSFDRNKGLSHGSTFARGNVISASDVIGMYPDVRRDGLLGGALWLDAVCRDGARLIDALRKCAADQGAVIVENTRAVGIKTGTDGIAGVTACSGPDIEAWRAPLVVNATGPWCASMAAALDQPLPELFRPSLAFDLMLNVRSPSSVGLSLSPPNQNDPTVFLYPANGHTFAGTWHAPWRDGPDSVQPPTDEIDRFLGVLNDAVPSLGARREQVAGVYAGLLPVTKEDGVALSDREIIHDHGKNGGPVGLFSVSGVKFTTSRRVAEKVVNALRTSGRVSSDKQPTRNA